MTSALDDIVVVIEWLAAQKTPTGQVAEALDRLRKRAHYNIPVEKIIDPPELRNLNLNVKGPT